MKKIFTLTLLLFMGFYLSAQTDCTVQITYTINKSNPPSYTFTSSYTGTDAQFYWYFSDNTTSNEINPTHHFKVSDTYQVSLKVLDKSGKVCVGSLKERFEGANLPTITPVILSEKGKVSNLSAIAGCGLVIVTGNGTNLIPSEIIPNFILKEGQYVEFAYEVLNNRASICMAGPMVKIHKITEITAPSVCKAYFEATNKLWSDRSMLKKVAFSNLSTGEIKECVWKFGDGTTSTELKPIHEYADFGEYKVCLIIVTTNGCTSDYCAAVKVENWTTVANCKFDLIAKADPAAADKFHFYAITPAMVQTWKWSFGDGQTSADKEPVHKYEKPGTYEVTCTITTSDGCTESHAIKLMVASPALPVCKGAISLVLTDPSGIACNGKATVKLLDESGNEYKDVKYAWSNGTTGNTTGNLCPDKPYYIQAIIESVCQKNTSFTILSKPIWQFIFKDGAYVFSVVNPTDNATYKWEFGDGRTAWGPIVNYNFDKEGIYSVKLTVNAGSDAATFSQEVPFLKSVTEIKEITKNDVSIYPNPARDFLKIEFGKSLTGKIRVEITNIVGRSVISQQVETDGRNLLEMNIQQLPQGIYIANISGRNGLITSKKILIEK